MNKNNIYWIGGSPCCGKSTIAEKLVEDYGYKYYKCDDHLERYMSLGVEDKEGIMLKFSTMTTDETWLRDIDEMVDDEFEFYHYATKIIEDDLKAFSDEDKIIVEGAALLPEFIHRLSISNNRYLCMTPKEKFQVTKYNERTWVKDYLSDCRDWQLAFSNWMSRDIKFASIVRDKVKEIGYVSLEIDGSQSIEEVYSFVKEHFELD